MRKVGYPLRSSMLFNEEVRLPVVVGQLLIEVEQLLYEDGPLLCGRPDL